MKKIAVLLLITLFANVAFAVSPADEFNVHQWPVEPVLIVNSEPSLCAEILSDARNVFASKASDMNIESETAKRLKPLEWISVFDEIKATSSFVGRLDLDLGKTGNKQVVIYRSNEHSWRGNWNYAYVYPSITGRALSAVALEVRSKPQSVAQKCFVSLITN